MNNLLHGEKLYIPQDQGFEELKTIAQQDERRKTLTTKENAITPDITEQTKNNIKWNKKNRQRNNLKKS